MKPSSILVLDSFFNVVQWRGKNIESWVEQNFQQYPDYSYLSKLLNNVNSDV
jgi:hypothetical protein